MLTTVSRILIRSALTLSLKAQMLFHSVTHSQGTNKETHKGPANGSLSYLYSSGLHA